MPRQCLQKISLLVEEYEAIRLKDYLGLEQQECAKKMRISRPTFQRILVEARKKVVEALINGRELYIEGGEYCLGAHQCQRLRRGSTRSSSCPYKDHPAAKAKKQDKA